MKTCPDCGQFVWFKMSTHQKECPRLLMREAMTKVIQTQGWVYQEDDIQVEAGQDDDLGGITEPLPPNTITPSMQPLTHDELIQKLFGCAPLADRAETGDTPTPPAADTTVTFE